jgi:hypothetical protein
VQELAEKVESEPEDVWSIINDPDFRSHLTQTKSAHVSHLEILHRIAMERLAQVLSDEKDNRKAEDLSKWILQYATDSIVKVSELNSEQGNIQGDGGITINQMLGRDPFKHAKG